MVRYNAIEDPLCYPGTHVLINKVDLQDQDELDQYEQLMFESRALEDLPPGELDFEHYKSIHHHFFQDVYDWAGEIRTIRTGKGTNWFCYPEYIEAEGNRIFQELANRDYLTASESKREFAEGAAWFLSEINAVHPFREGNGRTQLVFLTMLARNAGYRLNERKLKPTPFLDAMIRSFDGELGPLSDQIELMI